MRSSRSQYYSDFDPRSVGGCALWLDAADSKAVVLSGSSVTQWTDKSGRGNHAVQTISSSYYPTYSSSQVVFDGANSFLQISNPSIRPTNAYVVWKPVGTTGGLLSKGRTTGTGGDQEFRLSYAPGTGIYQYTTYYGTASNVGLAVTGNITQSANIQLVETTWDTGTIVLYNNGTQIGTGALAGNQFVSPGPVTDMRIGAFYAASSNTAAPSSLFNGSIYEILMFDYALTAQNRNLIEGYLMWKWGTNASIPVSHPWYLSRPVKMRPIVFNDIGALPQYWYDAADTSTITSSGNTLTAWTNKGTNTGSNISVSLGTPTTGSVATQNSLNVVGLGGAAVIFTGAFSAQARTRFFAARPTTNAAGSTLLNQSNQGTAADIVSVINQTSRITEQVGTTVRIEATLANQSNIFSILTFRNATSSTGANRIASNGNALALTTSTTATGYLTTSITSNRIGSNVDIGDWISFNSELSADQTFRVEGYLAWKWGLQGSLPSTHRFRYIQPYSPQFTPRMISGCVLWWDAADPTQFTGGSTWGDKSGTGNTGVNGTPGSSTMPSLTTWTNGNTAARFVSASSNSVKTTNTITNTNVSYFLVFRLQAAVGGTTFLMKNNVDANRQIFTTASTFPATILAQANSATFPNQTVATVNQSDGLLLNYIIGFQVWSNGTQVTVPTGATTSSASVHYFGSSNGNAGYITADIGEVVIFTPAPSSNDRITMEGYLAWKWGLETKLPSTHPYRYFKP